MSSDLSRLALQAVITKIESARETQSEIDNIYATLCDAIITEMDNCIPLCDTSKRTRKRHKTQKPYWNDELMNLWSVMHAKEKLFLNCTGRPHTKTQLRLEFLASQNKKTSIKPYVDTNVLINGRFVITSKICRQKILTNSGKK